MIARTVPILDLDDSDDVYGRDPSEFDCRELKADDANDCDHAYLAQYGTVRCIYCGRRAG